MSRTSLTAEEFQRRVLPGPWVFAIRALDYEEPPTHADDHSRDEEHARRAYDLMKHGRVWLVAFAATRDTSFFGGAGAPKRGLAIHVEGRHARTGQAIFARMFCLDRARVSAAEFFCLVSWLGWSLGHVECVPTVCDLEMRAIASPRPVWVAIPTSDAEASVLLTIAAYLDDDSGQTKLTGRG